MRKIARINSRLYYNLRTHSSDGCRLLAVYLHIRQSRGNKPYYRAYTSNNNKYVSGYNLLHQETNISLSALRKYVPALVELKLISFDEAGNVFIKGTKQINKEYVSKSGKAKIIPVIISEKFTKTADSILAVSLHSEFRQQKMVVQQKKAVATLHANKSFKDLKKLKKAEKKLKKKYGKQANIITDYSTLSNMGFHYLKNPNEKYDNNKKTNNTSKGQYLKAKLKKQNIIKSKRIFERVLEGWVDYKTFLRFRQETGDYTLLYKGSMVVRELTSLISLVEERKVGGFSLAMQ